MFVFLKQSANGRTLYFKIFGPKFPRCTVLKMYSSFEDRSIDLVVNYLREFKKRRSSFNTDGTQKFPTPDIRHSTSTGFIALRCTQRWSSTNRPNEEYVFPCSSKNWILQLKNQFILCAAVHRKAGCLKKKLERV